MFYINSEFARGRQTVVCEPNVNIAAHCLFLYSSWTKNGFQIFKLPGKNQMKCYRNIVKLTYLCYCLCLLSHYYRRDEKFTTWPTCLKYLLSAPCKKFAPLTYTLDIQKIISENMTKILKNNFCFIFYFYKKRFVKKSLSMI